VPTLPPVDFLVTTTLQQQGVRLASSGHAQAVQCVLSAWHALLTTPWLKASGSRTYHASWNEPTYLICAAAKACCILNVLWLAAMHGKLKNMA
jgi:hypothetical protein